MAFSTNNIGKNCYINISEDQNIEDSLYGTIIGYYKDTDKNEEYYFVSINGNVKRIYDDSLVNIVEDGGGGSGAVASVNGKTGTVVLDAEDVGAEPEKFVVTVTDDGQGNLSADKTFAEIYAAYTNKKTVIADFEGIPYFSAKITDADVLFLNFDEYESGYYVSYIRIEPDYDDPDTSPDIISWGYSNLVPSKFVINSSQVSIDLATTGTEKVFNCTAAALTSLTITNPPATGSYSIVFTSGSVATTTTIPATILGLEDFAPEANTIYEINVLDNRAVVGKWAVSA